MDDVRLFEVLAQCFGPVSQDEWECTTDTSQWHATLSRLRTLLHNGEAFGMPAVPARSGTAVSLQECLSETEVNALFAPPTFEEKQAFAACHFTGGLPDSALPVESLYVDWTQDPARGPFAGQKGLYLSDVALYMRDLIASLGRVVPQQLSASPDHLSLELECVSLLLEADQIENARQLLIERTAWLTAFRMKLVALGDTALFYLALVDVLLGIRTQQATVLELAG